MTKVLKNTKQCERTKNRVRVCRAAQAILNNDNMNAEFLVDAKRLKKKLNNTANIETDPENEREKKGNLSHILRSWAIEYHVKQRAVTKLLKILIAAGFHSLPNDSRALLSTPRSVEIENRAGGRFWYNGLQNCLTKIFAKLAANLSIQINVNVDGLPLFKSSPIGFWPILADIEGISDVVHVIFCNLIQ